MQKDSLDMQIRQMDNELNRCTIEIEDVINEIRVCMQEVKVAIQDHHIHRVHRMRSHLNILRNRVFLSTKAKERYLEQKLDWIRNRVMQPKRRNHVDDDDADVPGADPALGNVVMARSRTTTAAMSGAAQTTGRLTIRRDSF